MSIHVDPTNYYPFFSGYADEYGAGEGEGNLNIPLQPGSGDADFLDALDDALEAIRAHRSEALLVSVGFDAHERDPLSVLKVTNDGYRRIGDAVAALKLPTVLVQEGGYNLDLLGANVVASSAASTSRAGCRWSRRLPARSRVSIARARAPAR